MSIMTEPGGTANGLPVARGYVYRGTGKDTLTGHLNPRRVREEIARAEGDGYARPLAASEVWGLGEIDPSRTGGTRCAVPMADGDECGRPAGHGTNHISRGAYGRMLAGKRKARAAA